MDYAYWWLSRKYNPAIKARWLQIPKLFICGHSHILKVMFDKKHNLLHMNPGACGKVVFISRSMLRFVIERRQNKRLEIIEIEGV
jgi:predicted phosphodiesterase